jgi:hypothetical protein
LSGTSRTTRFGSAGSNSPEHPLNSRQDFRLLGAPAAPACDFDRDSVCNVNDINLLLAEGPIAEGVAVTSGVNDQFDLDHDNHGGQ